MCKYRNIIVSMSKMQDIEHIYIYEFRIGIIWMYLFLGFEFMSAMYWERLAFASHVSPSWIILLKALRFRITFETHVMSNSDELKKHRTAAKGRFTRLVNELERMIDHEDVENEFVSSMFNDVNEAWKNVNEKHDNYMSSTNGSE